jgi:CRISPR-associated protein Cas5d
VPRAASVFTACLGTREFPADFTLIDEAQPLPDCELPSDQRNRDLGWMLYDIDYSGPRPMPLFFEARLVAGSLAVPDPISPELRR